MKHPKKGARKIITWIAILKIQTIEHLGYSLQLHIIQDVECRNPLLCGWANDASFAKGYLYWHNNSIKIIQSKQRMTNLESIKTDNE